MLVCIIQSNLILQDKKTYVNINKISEEHSMSVSVSLVTLKVTFTLENLYTHAFKSSYSVENGFTLWSCTLLGDLDRHRRTAKTDTKKRQKQRARKDKIRMIFLSKVL